MIDDVVVDNKPHGSAPIVGGAVGRHQFVQPIEGGIELRLIAFLAVGDRGYACGAAHLGQIFGGRVIDVARFVGNKSVNADFTLRLVAVCGEIAHAEGFIDDAEVVVGGRVEGEAQIFCFQV